MITDLYENTSVTMVPLTLVPVTSAPVSGIVTRIEKYSLAVIIAGGLACNTLSLCVFLTSKLRRSTAGHYLVALSFADNCVLFGEALIWFTKHLDLHVTNQSTVMCRLTYFLRYGGRLWSALITTIITAERYLFIAYPLERKRFLTPSGARRVIVVVPLVSFALTSYAPFILHVSPKSKQCTIPSARYTEFIVWDLVVSRLLCDVVTGFFVAIFTIMIVRTLVLARQQRHRMLPDIVETCRQGIQVREFQLTVVLVMVAVSFILLKLPYTVSWYVKRYLEEYHKSDYDDTAINNIIPVTYIFAVGCYATNLFFYSLGGSIFRANLQHRFRGMLLSFMGTNHRTSTTATTDAQVMRGTAV